MKLTKDLSVCALCIVLIVMLNPLLFGKDKNQVSVQYDRFKDVTYVSSQPHSVKELHMWNDVTLGVGSITLQFMYACTGNTSSCRPKRVVATYTAYVRKGWVYIHSHSLIFIADGARIRPNSEEEWNGELGSCANCDSMETIIATFEVDDFLKLAHANSVDGQAGPTEFRVLPKDITKWRALADKIRE